MNFIWIVIPGSELIQLRHLSGIHECALTYMTLVLLYNSIDVSAKALKAVEAMSSTPKVNGHTKKSN